MGVQRTSKLLVVMRVSIILTVVMVACVPTCIRTSQIVHSTRVWLVGCRLYLSKDISCKKKNGIA